MSDPSIRIFVSHGDHLDSLNESFRVYHKNIRNVESTVKVLQSVGPWADHFVSELAPVVQNPVFYFLNNVACESLERLNVVTDQLKEEIQVLGSFGSWAEELIDCLQHFRTLIEDRIKVVLRVLGIPVFPQEVLVRDNDFFEYHGCGRPPRTLGRALKAGLSLVTGRMRSSPALA
jgi:hypothetical protein